MEYKRDNSDIENTIEPLHDEGKLKLQFKYKHSLHFKCLTCGRKLASEDSMKKHIKTLHGSSDPNIVLYTSFIHAKKMSNTSAVIPSPPPEYEGAEQLQPHAINDAEILAKKSRPSFVSPALKPSSKQPKSQNKTNSGNILGSTEMKTGKKVNFSQSLSNMFTSGKILMEKVSMWGKKLNKTKPQGQHQKDSLDTIPAVLGKESTSRKSSGDGDGSIVDRRSRTEPLEHEEEDNQELDEQQHMKEPEILLEIGDNMETTENIKAPPKTREKKTCGYVDCEPCSIHTDCMECKFCKNKKQKKQSCEKRQCHRVNSKVRNVEALRKQFEYYNPDQSCHDEPGPNTSEISRRLSKQIIDDMVGLAWEMITSPTDIQENRYKPKMYNFAKCGKEFAQFLSPLKHCNTKKSPDEGAFCPICGKKLALKRNLRRHIKEVHDGSKEKPVNVQRQPDKPKCSQCGKVYSSKNKLVEHLHSKHGVARKGGPKIKCSKCDFKHSSHSRVKAHMTLKHSSSFDFECSFCDAKFKSRGGREKHIRIVHNQVIPCPPAPVAPSVPVVAKRSVPLPIEVQNSVQFPLNNNQYQRRDSAAAIGQGATEYPLALTDGIQAQVTPHQHSRHHFPQLYSSETGFQFSGLNDSSQAAHQFPASNSSHWDAVSPLSSQLPLFHIRGQNAFPKTNFEAPLQIYPPKFSEQTISLQSRYPLPYSHFSSMNDAPGQNILVPSQQQSHQSYFQFPGQEASSQIHHQVPNNMFGGLNRNTKSSVQNLSSLQKCTGENPSQFNDVE